MCPDGHELDGIAYASGFAAGRACTFWPCQPALLGCHLHCQPALLGCQLETEKGTGC